MSITLKEEIGYSSRTMAAYILPAGPLTDAKKLSIPKTRDSSISSPYAEWGNSNDLPNKMAKDIEECGVLSAGLDAKARIAVGKGPQPFLLLDMDKEGKEDIEPVFDSECLDWFEDNDTFSYSLNSIYDKYSYGWTPTQMILSRNRKRINRIFRTDTVTARLAKKNEKGFIDYLYLSTDWETESSVASEYVSKVPILEEGYEFQDLAERNSGFEFAMISRQLRNGRGYYPPTLWYSAKRWVDHAKAIPALKNAMMKNQITIKYLVTISSGYWRRMHTKWDTYLPPQRKQIMDDKLKEIDDYLVGVENQYKSIITSSYVDVTTGKEVPDIKIEVLDDKVKDGKLLPDSAAANSEILFALQVNPALIGAGQPGGAYANNAGGSNIREAHLSQMMTTEWERRDNAKIFTVVKRYNAWDKRLELPRTIVPVTQVPGAGASKERTPRLVFRYPSGLLTTLDTGKSTKGEVL